MYRLPYGLSQILDTFFLFLTVVSRVRSTEPTPCRIITDVLLRSHYGIATQKLNAISLIASNLHESVEQKEMIERKMWWALHAP